MTVYDSVCALVARELELERELGVRAVEFDRAFLKTLLDAGAAATAAMPAVTASAVRPKTEPPISAVTASAVRPKAEPPISAARPATPPPRPQAAAATPPPASPSAGGDKLVFLADQPLQGEAAVMMTKAMAALKALKPHAAELVSEGALPAARAYVVLGSAALAKWFPGARAVVGQWATLAGHRVLLTESPTRIQRFMALAPDSVQELKRKLWSDFKSALAQL